MTEFRMRVTVRDDKVEEFIKLVADFAHKFSHEELHAEVLGFSTALDAQEVEAILRRAMPWGQIEKHNPSQN